MSVSLRTGEDGDLMAVGALHCRSRCAAYAEIFSAETLARLSPEALGAWWSERWRWERETHRLTVAEADGRLVGFTYVGPSEGVPLPTPGPADGAEDPGRSTATELYAIHVEPGVVGTGVGRLLMGNALVQLAELGGDRAVLWVLEANERARRFYDRGGWAPDGGTRVEPVNGEPVPQLRYAHPL